MTTLSQVLNVVETKCINCHACISACPVKYCNDGSGDIVSVNKDMCIACGKCISACTHDARTFIDDFDNFINAVIAGEKIVAVSTPSVAAGFPEQYLNLNGWLKEMGVEAIFDVSFGAELTVKSYVEYIKENNPKTVIAQPCPAIVNYIELYLPELIKYLAPVDSPIVHTIKMIKEYYPQYKNHKIVIVSPCTAKKREFEASGLGDYNIAQISIKNFLKENNSLLYKFPAVEFDNPPAERAVLFSSPGGLLETVKRWLPKIAGDGRKIEGNPHVYDYLATLPEMIEQGITPVIIDCLNCEYGCNSGPLTLSKDKTPDEIEYWIKRRSKEQIIKYFEESGGKKMLSKQKIEQILDKYWKKSLYNRSYIDRSKQVEIVYPTIRELNHIYEEMHKYTQEDIKNCSSCGYGSCEAMAVAVRNKLNRPENCHHFLIREQEIANEALEIGKQKLKAANENLEEKVRKRTRDLTDANEEIQQQNEEIKQQNEEMLTINDVLEKSNKVITRQKKSILDSIDYARKIQDAILQIEKTNYLNEIFILFQPKEVVSGDFYMAKKLFNYSIIVAADGTGHGVPGAFMSLLGMSLLNETLSKHYRKISKSGFTASKILDDLRSIIIKTLHQTSSNVISKDGIDIAICIVNNDNGELQFAGAYHPLILIRNNRIKEIKGDRMPVGVHVQAENQKKFTNHVIQLESNDVFYIFSDGYQDQFGGNRGRKFMKRNLNELLLNIHDKPMKDQKAILKQTLDKYMIGEPQTDDIVFIGARH